MLKTVEKTISILGKEINDGLKKIQIKLLELKTTMSEVKTISSGIESRLVTTE